MSQPCKCARVHMRPPKDGGVPVETLVGSKSCKICRGLGRFESCSKCDGAGMVNSQVCNKCGGCGKVGVKA